MIVYDIANSESFGGFFLLFFFSSFFSFFLLFLSSANFNEHSQIVILDIHLWMKGLEKFTFLQKIIVGNKCDLAESRVCNFFFLGTIFLFISFFKIWSMILNNNILFHRKFRVGGHKTLQRSTMCSAWRQVLRMT